MPEIYSGTGVLKTPELSITKAAGTLIFQSSKALSALTNEVISIWIERNGGNNVVLAQKISLKEFIMACLCNGRANVTVIGGMNVSVVNIGLEGAINIGDSDKIKVLVEGLIAGDTWKINYVEDVVSTSGYFEFEKKAVLGAEFDKTIDVSGNDIAIIKHANALDLVGLYFSDGSEKRFTTFELQALYLEDSPFLAFTAAGVVIPQDEAYILLPLVGIEKIRIYKSTATDISFTLMRANELVASTTAAVKSVRSLGGTILPLAVKK